MKKRGSGRIIVTASTAGFGTDPIVGYSYSATKAAVIISCARPRSSSPSTACT